jgi:hypothetical protein
MNGPEIYCVFDEIVLLENISSDESHLEFVTNCFKNIAESFRWSTLKPYAKRNESEDLVCSQ